MRSWGGNVLLWLRCKNGSFFFVRAREVVVLEGRWVDWFGVGTYTTFLRIITLNSFYAIRTSEMEEER